MRLKIRTEVLLSVIMPVYNEAETLGMMIHRVLKDIHHDLELIVIDDGSTDGSGAIADACASKDSRIHVIHQSNGGKTSALRRGFQISRGAIVIVQDADAEYDPSEIDPVIQPILNGHADVVYGSRFLVRRAARVLYYYHFLANSVLTRLSNLLTNLNMTDVETGYKAFRGEIIRNMIIKSRGFGVEIEVTAKFAKLGARLYEVLISYDGRTYQEGKKIGVMDGILAIWYIFRFNLFCSLGVSFKLIPRLKEERSEGSHR